MPVSIASSRQQPGVQQLIAAASALAVTASMAGPLSDTAVVNIYRPGLQTLASGEAAGNGDILQSWVDDARGGHHFMQRFDSNGNRVQSDDWYLAPSSWKGVKLAAGRSGNTVSVGSVPEGNGQAVYAQVHGRDGSQKVAAFKVNATAGTRMDQPVVAVNSRGEFVVVWGLYTAGNQGALYARVFAANGAPLTGELAIQGLGAASYNPQDVAIDDNRNFAPVWLVNNVWEIYAARVNANSAFVTAPTLVNTTTAGAQVGPRIAMNAKGQTVVVWESQGQDGDQFGIYAQRLDRNGARVGGEFRVNETGAGDQGWADVGVADDGSFAVSWVDGSRQNPPSTPTGVLVRQYRADGVPLRSPDVVLPRVTANPPWFTRLAMDPAGHFTVSWSAGTDAYGGQDVLSRRFLMDTTPPFQTVTSGTALANLSSATGTWRYYKINVPAGATRVTAQLSGGTGDADLYMRLGALPGAGGLDAASERVGNTEGIQITGIPPGAWYVGVYAYAGYAGLTLTVSYQ